MSEGRIIRLLFAVATAVVLALPQAASACSVCFGKSDSSLVKGMQMGVLALLAIVVFVLAGFAAFLIYLVRRSALIAQSAETPASSTEGIPTQEIVANHE